MLCGLVVFLVAFFNDFLRLGLGFCSFMICVQCSTRPIGMVFISLANAHTKILIGVGIDDSNEQLM